MAELKACGFIIFRKQPGVEFLLLRHDDRWDLPKGHVDPGESEKECALRELEEETGIRRADIDVDDQFRFETRYHVRSKRTGFEPREKTLIIFLAWLHTDVEISLTEHPDFTWCRWNPPHDIQKQTINSLLEQVASHFTAK